MLAITAAEQATYVGEDLWVESGTLFDRLLAHAEARPLAEAVVDSYGTRLTYGELKNEATALAAALAARDIGAGDVVGLQMPNRAEASIIACALDRIGAIVVPLTTMFREHELNYVTSVTDMKALFVPGVYRSCDHDLLALTVKDAAAKPLRLISLTDSPAQSIESLRALIAEGGESGTAAQQKRDPNAIAAILMTSGTEAAPKAVVHTHNTLDANLRGLISILDLDKEAHVFMASPVGHGTGYGFGIRLAVLLGSKLVLQDQWDSAQASALMTREQVVYTHASTTFAQDLLEFHEGEDHGLRSLRYFVSGGAAVPPGFAARMHARIGCTLLRLYGQTEAFMTTINRPEDQTRLDGFDGRAAPGVEVAIWSDNDEPVKPGETGEIVCRGPHRCQGFYRDPERTACAITPTGWLRMGDLGVMDADGYIRVVGRIKEVVSRGGYKYSPREVEDMLANHPAILRVAIVRVPDRRLGERACACVIPRDQPPSLDDLTSYLRGHGLAPYKLPEQLLVLKEFPTTPSGKVQKFELERLLSGPAQ